MMRTMTACLLGLGLAACQPGGGISVPGDSDDHSPYLGITPQETIRFTGTEPFWGGSVQGERLVYSTPEKPDGTVLTVKRFAGRGGLSFSGELGGKSFDLMVTARSCTDGMSDRTYPFTVALMLGDALMQGCAWTDEERYTGPQTP